MNGALLLLAGGAILAAVAGRRRSAGPTTTTAAAGDLPTPPPRQPPPPLPDREVWGEELLLEGWRVRLHFIPGIGWEAVRLGADGELNIGHFKSNDPDEVTQQFVEFWIQIGQMGSYPEPVDWPEWVP